MKAFLEQYKFAISFTAVLVIWLVARAIKHHLL
jgi:hypothetical protein